MRRYSVIILIAFLIGCTGKIEEVSNVETIPVCMDEVTQDASAFVEKIEAVPLECDDSLSLIKGYRKLMYDHESDVYAVLDERFVVLLFAGDGKFIASSEDKRGDGPDQYQMIVDIKFNPFYKGIDLLNPYGIIYTYDYAFNLIDKKDWGQTEISFCNFMAYDSHKYLFTPSFLMDDGAVFWVDYSCKKSVKGNYEGTLSNINMDRESFYKLDSVYYFVPTGINYYFYQLDMKTHSLVPYMKLDFGKEEIKEDELPGKLKDNKGVNTSEEQRIFIRQLQERNKYVEESSHVLPLIKFFNDKYVYVHYIKNRRPSNYIYNRKTKRSFLQHGEKPFRMPFCFAIDGDVLFSVVEAFEIERYINEEYMSQETIRKLKNVKEDDNPIMLKYYLQ